jgi:hypothetical protein
VFQTLRSGIDKLPFVFNIALFDFLVEIQEALCAAGGQPKKIGICWRMELELNWTSALPPRGEKLFETRKKTAE